jgi:hypothetical protein
LTFASVRCARPIATHEEITMMRSARVVVAAVAVAAALVPVAVGATSGAAGAGECPLPLFGPGSAYHPHIERATFTAHVTNPYFPLRVGRTYVYAGTKDGEPAIDIVTPSRNTRVVDGVETRVVEDRLFLSGVLHERTADYYAQDKCGNVWYFGEDTAELDEHGRVVDTSGSFHAGVDGAQPGVFMERAPELGRRFRQEWYQGEAEDTFEAIDLSTRVAVPYGAFDHALKTEETTALEPGVVDHKLYVAGIGEVVEKSVQGATEQLVLVDVLS